MTLYCTSAGVKIEQLFYTNKSIPRLNGEPIEEA